MPVVEPRAETIVDFFSLLNARLLGTIPSIVSLRLFHDRIP